MVIFRLFHLAAKLCYCAPYIGIVQFCSLAGLRLPSSSNSQGPQRTWTVGAAKLFRCVFKERFLVKSPTGPSSCRLWSAPILRVFKCFHVRQFLNCQIYLGINTTFRRKPFPALYSHFALVFPGSDRHHSARFRFRIDKIPVDQRGT